MKKREQVLNALREAESFITALGPQADAPPQERAQAEVSAVLLALVADELCPASLFRPWASARRIRQWREHGVLNVSVVNGKNCVRPSDFFALFNALSGGKRT